MWCGQFPYLPIKDTISEINGQNRETLASNGHNVTNRNTLNKFDPAGGMTGPPHVPP